MNTLELDSQLNRMIVEGKSVDAFEKFYDENVVAQENDEPERHGRAPWLRHGNRWKRTSGNSMREL